MATTETVYTLVPIRRRRRPSRWRFPVTVLAVALLRRLTSAR